MSYEKKFTPGTWAFTGLYSIKSGDIVVVDDIGTGVKDANEYIANSYLIAAAPELLDALIECVHFLDGCLLDPMCKKDAKKAINKALNIKNDEL